MIDHSRQHWMSILARADSEALTRASDGLLPDYVLLRRPEAGLVLVRGREGGCGQPFNLGEATVVRCSVRSAEAYIGHAYCLGRDLRHAELAAVLDAGLQDPARHARLYEMIVGPLETAQAENRALVARRAAATQVQFFTMAAMRT